MVRRTTIIRILKPVTTFSAILLVVSIAALIRNAQLNFSNDLAEALSRLSPYAFGLTLVSSIALKILSRHDKNSAAHETASTALTIAIVIGLIAAAVFGWFVLAFRSW